MCEATVDKSKADITKGFGVTDAMNGTRYPRIGMSRCARTGDEYALHCCEHAFMCISFDDKSTPWSSARHSHVSSVRFERICTDWLELKTIRMHMI